MTGRVVTPYEITTLLYLRYQHPMLFAAWITRYRALMIPEIEITCQGKRASATAARILQEYWISNLLKIVECISGIGCVPFRVMKQKIKTPRDDVREAKYGNLAAPEIVEPVPIIPDPSTYRLRVQVTQNGKLEITAESLIDDEPMYVASSSIYNGPTLIGIDSEMSVLYPELQRLKYLENLAMGAYYDRARPTYVIEEIMPTDTVAAAMTQDRYTAESFLMTDKPPMTYQIEQTTEIKRPESLENLHKRMRMGEAIDPLLNMVTLPPLRTPANHQPPLAEIPADLSEYRARFESTITCMIKVPESYLHGSKDVTLNGKQNHTASINDRLRFRQGVDSLRRDIRHVFRQMYDTIHGQEIEVDIPIEATSELETLIMLRDTQAIGQPEFIAEARKAVGLSNLNHNL